MRLRLLYIAILTSLLLACRTYYEPKFAGNYSQQINPQQIVEDSTVNAIIHPYKSALDTIMSQVLIYNVAPLQKAKPEGTLNNLFCDIQLQLVNRQYPQFAPMFCVMNYGGIRLTSIAAGSITRGKVYELMPFDNELVVAKINGSTVREIGKLIAGKGGEPIAGIRMQIHSQVASDIRINGETVQDTLVYYLLLSDYMLNGGDGYGFVKEQAIALYPLGIKVRDALIGEMEWMQAKGLMLTGKTDGRLKEVK
jgi:2',3'-cyclic-nucleotide 2'-phosphodiesterase (5'-nucleotidase family)